MTPDFDNYTVRRFTYRGILAVLSTRSICRLVSHREYITGVNSISVTTWPQLRPTPHYRWQMYGFFATLTFASALCQTKLTTLSVGFRKTTIITTFVLLPHPFFKCTDCGVLYRIIKTNTFRSSASTPEAFGQGFALYGALISYFIA